jgi:hypothetical protein
MRHEEEQDELGLICQHSTIVERAYYLTQAFVTMARERSGQPFDARFGEIEASQIPIPELRRFCSRSNWQKSSTMTCRVMRNGGAKQRKRRNCNLLQMSREYYFKNPMNMNALPKDGSVE